MELEVKIQYIDLPLSDLGISVMLTSESELNLNMVVAPFWCQHLKGWGNCIPVNEFWGQPGLHSELQVSLGYTVSFRSAWVTQWASGQLGLHSELQVSLGYTVRSFSWKGSQETPLYLLFSGMDFSMLLAFFLKRSLEFTNDTTWVWCFHFGKGLIINSLYLIDKSLFGQFLSPRMSLGRNEELAHFTHTATFAG